MKPYYQDNAVTIYHGDCLEVLGSLPSNSVDAVVTSPPYNLGSNHHTANKKTQAYDDEMPETDYQAWQVDVLNECLRVCNGWMFYNHQHRIRDGVLIKPDRWIEKTSWIWRQEIIWNRGSPNMDPCRFYPFTERIYIGEKAGNLHKFVNTRKLTDDWHISPVGSGGIHTRQYPEQVPQNCIASVPTARVVFDPFGGSGTTARAAKDLGRVAIISERDERYCEFAAKRMGQGVLALEGIA